MAHPLNTIDTILARLRREGGHWLYSGALASNGYAKAQLAGRAVMVHRAVYEHFAGPIPDGLHIDHLCRVRHCANPAHLEPVTCRENLLRGGTDAARKFNSHSCVNGHPFDDANTRRRPDGTRSCRACSRAHTASYRARRKARP